MFLFFLFKQKTAYEMRISDWSSDVCSSDLGFADDLAIVGAPSVARVDPRRDAGAGGTGPARGALYQRGADADRYGIAAVRRRADAGDRTHGRRARRDRGADRARERADRGWAPGARKGEEVGRRG